MIIQSPCTSLRSTQDNLKIQQLTQYQGVGCWLLGLWLVLANAPCNAQTERWIRGKLEQSKLIERYQADYQHAIELANRLGWPLRKKYSNGQVFQLQQIDPTGFPIYYRTHNANASAATQTTNLYEGGMLGLALSGSADRLSGRLGMWDGGRALATHREFGVGRVRNMETTGDLSDHTTHLAGTMMAQGLNSVVRGMAYGANLFVWNFENDVPEMAAAAGQLLLSNHAYGPVVGWVLNPDRPGNDLNQKWEWWGNTAISASEDYQFGFYTSKASDIDRILYNNPYYLAVRSADNKHAETGPPANTAYYIRNTNEKSTLTRSRNDGFDVIGAEATAKNVLTVGAADVSQVAGQGARFNVSGYSGWGPTDDGRVKPDLLGVGVPLLSTLASGTTSYGAMMGTSMASANVTGSLLLLQELYSRQQPDQFMRAATLRTLVLHTASRIQSVNTLTVAPPDYKQGWGLLNMRQAAQVILNDNEAHLLQELTLLQGATNTYQVVAQGNEPLMVTIGWTDPEAAPTPVSSRFLNSRVPKLVNDLDLRVSDELEVFAPWVLNPNRPELAATTGNNIRDNVEQVVIQNPVPGRIYTIRVSHKGELRYASQPFSLAVSGLSRVACRLAVSLMPPTDTIYCPDKSIVLRAGQAKAKTSGALTTDATYEWLLDGQVLSGIAGTTCVVSQPGVYSLRLTDRNGCVGTSPRVVIREAAKSSSLTPSGNQLLCASRPYVQLSTSPETGTIFEWLRNGRLVARGQSSYTVTSAGEYAVRINQQGCVATSPPVTVESESQLFTAILPVDPEILIPAGSSVRLQVPPNASYGYQWLRNDQLLPNADASRLLADRPGLYRVRVSQQGCTAFSSVRAVRWSDNTSATSLPDSILQFNPADSTLLIFPNPATNQVSIRYFRPLTTAFVATIYNTIGGIAINTITFQYKEGVLEADIPVSMLPPGHYFLQLIDGPRVRRARFIKR